MSPPPTYSVRVSLYLKSHSVLLDSSHTDIQKWWVSHLHVLITQTLKKKLVEESPYFNTTIYRCCYTHVSLITTKSTLQRRLLLPWPGLHVWPSPPVCVLLFLVRAPAVFICSNLVEIHCSCSCVNEVSCLSHSHPKKHPRKLQSQVPECLAKPCPPLPRWDVLTLVTLVFIPYLCVFVSRGYSAL